MPAKYTSEQRIAKFWEKVIKSDDLDGCWIWTAHQMDAGYGRLRWGDNRLWLAHRISYLLANGECPANMDVLHTCDNPPCVNPAHLFLGTDLDNAADREQKKRGGQGAGERHWKHKITADDVCEIRRLRAEEGLFYREIGRRFGISRQEVGHIIRGENWKTK